MVENNNIRWVNMNQWEIVDDKGVLHSGPEDEMISKWEELTEGETEEEWTGDLKLVEVHGIHK